GLETLLMKQKEGYEKQVASMQAELQLARESAEKTVAAAPAGTAGQIDTLRGRLEEVVKERASLQSQVKSQSEMFVELKGRVENVQKLIKVKDERIAELERKLSERESEERKAARQTIRRIKTKLSIRSPEEEAAAPAGSSKERKEEEIEKLMDQVEHGRSEFEQKFRQLQERAMSGPKRDWPEAPKKDWPEAPKGEDKLKQEVQKITQREGHHTKVEGYELFITRAGLFGAFARKDIALELLGVSEDGLRACVNERLGDGDRLQVKLTVKKWGDTVDALADVVWCREVEFKARFDVELKWSRIREEDRRKVLRWIDFYSSLGKPPGPAR
ncbi:MAG TPA: PilZ domain-containing protein, partial [Planctomycetota bacterium]|nr:PilZ domain-containing protein [Planctomycetota bacterium]